MSRVHGAVAPSLALVAAAACWGVSTVISKRAVDEIAPLALLPIQLAVSTVVLSVAAAVAHQRPSGVPRLHLHAALGILNPGLAYALGLAGLARITASTSVLLWAAEPILILALAVVVLGQRVTPTLAALSGTAVAGVALVVFHGDADADLLGVTLTLAGVTACAVYAVLTSRLLADSSTIAVVLVQQAAALGFAMVSMVGWLALGDPSSFGTVSTAGWASAIASGVGYYGVAFCFYLAGLRRLPAAHAGVFINLVPVFGIATSAALLGERLTGRQWAGALLVLGAVSGAALTLGGGSPGQAGDRHRRQS